MVPCFVSGYKKSHEIKVCNLTVMHQHGLPSFDKCTAIVSDINNTENWVRNVCELSVLSTFEFSYISKIIPK